MDNGHLFNFLDNHLKQTDPLNLASVADLSSIKKKAKIMTAYICVLKMQSLVTGTSLPVSSCGPSHPWVPWCGTALLTRGSTQAKSPKSGVMP